MTYRFGPFSFEATEGLTRDGVEVQLPPRAIGVLAALLERAGTVVSKQILMDATWRDTFVTEASLLEVVRLLREALGDDRQSPTYIQTVHRRGYRFIAAVDVVAPRTEGEAKASPLRTNSKDPIFDRAEWRPLIVSGLAAVGAMVGIAIVFALFGQRPAEPRPTLRFTITLPSDAAIDPLRGSVAISNDGSRLVYAAIHRGRPRLFLRTIDRDTPTLIDGSDEAADPFFSPDGQWVGFFAHGSLKKLGIDGGRPIVLAAARAGAGATWMRDGTIIFGGGPGGGLARVSDGGGEPTAPVVLASPAPGSREVRYGWPNVLPDEQTVLFTALSLGDSQVMALDLASGARTVIADAAAFGRYSPTGHLVFERRGRLEAAPFSLATRRITSTPRPILRDVATGRASDGPRFAFSPSGSLVYVPNQSPDSDDRLHWLSANGQLEAIPLPPAPLTSVEMAADLSKLALVVEGDRGPDLWLGDLTRGSVSRWDLDGPGVSPTWRPNGLEIAFAYSKAGPFNIFVRPADGAGPIHALLDSPWNQMPTSWSPDGRRLAFTEYHPLTGADVWMVDVDSHERTPIVRSLFDESHARFSPDGRWLAYMSNDSGRWEVFVRPADGNGARVQVSSGGGAWPCWSSNGRAIYFTAADQTLVAAVRSGPALSISPPLALTSRNDLQLEGGRAGIDRVLVSQGGPTPLRRELRVVIEWFAELTRLVRRPA
jgi:Tol biopolymer transport system component/DNA-binding winged helix-turn-helix (wHTH) protein